MWAGFKQRSLCPRLALAPPPLYKRFRAQPRQPGSLPSRPNVYLTLDVDIDTL